MIMRETKPYVNNDVLNLQMFRAFDLIRGLVPTEDYDVILLLASLYKDGIITPENFRYNAFNVEKLLYGNRFDKNFKTGEYGQIIPAFETTLRRLGSRGIHELIAFFSNFDRVQLKERFPILFDSILYRLYKSQGKRGGEAIQPIELSQFICKLVDTPPYSTVYNPFAGLASFRVFLPDNINYFGQELNQRTWALGKLRLMAHKKSNESDYRLEDSLSNWPDSHRRFDLVISNPPFGLRVNRRSHERLSNFQTAEQFLIANGVETLSENGKLVVLVPTGFLFRGSVDGRIREDLVERGLLEMVISLPSGLLPNTGIQVALLVLNRTRGVRNSVKLVDAHNYLLPSDSRERKLDSNRLLSDIKSEDGESNNIISVQIDSIRENNYNLNVSRYFQTPVEGVKLKDILTFIQGARRDLPEQGKMIRIRDLKEDKLDFSLDLAEVNELDLGSRNIRKISQSCLLLAVRWNSLKPTLFDFTGEDIFLNPDILSFEINKDLVFPEFLVNELQADYVTDQINSYRQGATIPMIRKDDLLEVVVKLPSLKEQKAKFQGITELSDRIQKLERERNALAHGKSVSQYNEFASLKHTLGRPRQNILDWADNLISFLEANPNRFESLNQGFKEFYEADILAALAEIKRDVNFITDVLEKGENGLVLANYEKKIIPISDINKVVNELSSNSYNFRIIKQPLKGANLQTRGVYGNKVLLKTLIDNILTNAHKYGFESKEKGNQVVIELSEVDDALVLEFRNNGNSFPKNYDREKFITKYSTADSVNGSGLGGYDIHRIATDFQNPDWDLILDQDPIFSVKFKFQFPIKELI